MELEREASIFKPLINVPPEQSAVYHVSPSLYQSSLQKAPVVVEFAAPYPLATYDTLPVILGNPASTVSPPLCPSPAPISTRFCEMSSQVVFSKYIAGDVFSTLNQTNPTGGIYAPLRYLSSRLPYFVILLLQCCYAVRSQV